MTVTGAVPAPTTITVACALATIAVGSIGRRRLTIARRVPTPRLHRTARTRRRHVPRRLMAITVVAAVLFVAGVGAALTTGALLWLSSRVRPVLAHRRNRRAIERSIPDAFDFLVLCVRAGLTPQQAVRELAMYAPEPARPAFRSVVHRCDRGRPFPEALAALAEVLGPQAIALAEVIATSDRYGLPLGPMLDQVSGEARDARRRIDQADARKLPVRLSFPLVVCTLPSFVLLAIAPAVMAALTSLGGVAW